MARTPTEHRGEQQRSPTDADESTVDLDEHFIVIHEDEYSLVEADAKRSGDSTNVEYEIYDIQDEHGEDANVVAFNASAHPASSDVQFLDDVHAGVDVEATLRQAWLDHGRLDVLTGDDVIRCENSHRGLVWFVTLDGTDADAVTGHVADRHVVQYHSMDNFEADHSISADDAASSVAHPNVTSEVVGRDVLEAARGGAE